MIRRTADGRYYCDGRECGYPLAWMDGDIEDGDNGMWVCMDCNDAMYAASPPSSTVKNEAAVTTSIPKRGKDKTDDE
jgi:hypothetical protein